jgi:hypothetical protein
MKHRRNDHSDIVPECRDYVNNCCRFQKETCWFKHGERIENQEIKSPDMVERLFDMMEKFSERMEMMESQLYN